MQNLMWIQASSFSSILRRKERKSSIVLLANWWSCGDRRAAALPIILGKWLKVTISDFRFFDDWFWFGFVGVLRSRFFFTQNLEKLSKSPQSFEEGNPCKFLWNYIQTRRETNERKPPKRHHTLTAFICTCVTLVTQWMKILENCLIFPWFENESKATWLRW